MVQCRHLWAENSLGNTYALFHDEERTSLGGGALQVSEIASRHSMACMACLLAILAQRQGRWGLLGPTASTSAHCTVDMSLQALTC